MGEYSREPPRQHCIVHYTFSNIAENRVLDTSPQGLHGKVEGNFTAGHTGVVGESIRLQSEEAEVVTDGLPDEFPIQEVSLSRWEKSQYEVPGTEWNVRAEVTVEGSTLELEYTEDDGVDEWRFAALTYDGGWARLFYGNLDGELFIADEVRVGGGMLEDASIEFNSVGSNLVDDHRMYRRFVGADGIRDIYDIAYEQTSVTVFGEHWDNEGIPYRQGNRRLAGALGEQKSHIFRQIDFAQESMHIRTAGGEQLDRIGQTIGLRRRSGEGDELYRARIIGTHAAGRSQGTTNDIIETTATILGVDTDRVRLDTQYDTDPATVYVLIQNEDIDDTVLEPSDIKDILESSVIAGHDIVVQRTQDDPFTVRGDLQTNDPALGLTSDTLSSGGALVEDL